MSGSKNTLESLATQLAAAERRAELEVLPLGVDFRLVLVRDVPGIVENKRTRQGRRTTIPAGTVFHFRQGAYIDGPEVVRCFLHETDVSILDQFEVEWTRTVRPDGTVVQRSRLTERQEKLLGALRLDRGSYDAKLLEAGLEETGDGGRILRRLCRNGLVPMAAILEAGAALLAEDEAEDARREADRAMREAQERKEKP